MCAARLAKDQEQRGQWRDFAKRTYEIDGREADESRVTFSRPAQESSGMDAIIFACTALLAVVQFGMLFACLRKLHSRSWNAQHVARWPRAAILMGLKGADPFLGETLRKLMAQDYPDYELHIVVENQQDPAWPVVAEALRATECFHARVSEYRPVAGAIERGNTPKIVQALKQLDDTFEIVAMVDGDASAHPTWLKELVAPLVLDRRIGATCGNRWCIPEMGETGSVVRWVWSALAFVYMYIFDVAWGGTFAIRRETIRRCRLVEKWSRVISFDVATPGELQHAGLRIELVPTLMMINREECNLAFCQNFVQRQLTWVRLYHPRWQALFAMTMLSAVILPGAVLAFLSGIALQEASLAAWAGAGLVLYAAWALATIGLLELAVRRAARERGEIAARPRLKSLALLPFAIVATWFIQTVGTIRAALMSPVEWRGARLIIHGPHDIRVVGQSSPKARTGKKDSRASL
jgi:hypothetical protein